MIKNTLIDKLITLIEPITTDLKYELYHLEYVREGNEYYLRIYIDKENGGISLEDCEKVSRAVSGLLDVEDPIEEAYYLEVSSPGIDRVLYTEKHLQKYMGAKIEVEISGLLDGKKKYEGELTDFNSEELKIKAEGNEVSIPRNKVSRVNLRVEL